MTSMSVVDLASALIGFNSISSRSNLPVVDYIERYLAAYGVTSRRFPNADGTKAALFATIGPADRGGVCLSGHLDVVPVEGQPWSHDAFDARVVDGKLYGRGACDMKGFVAAALALVPELTKANLAVPVHLCFSYDEEVSCLGSVDVIAQFGLDLPRPILCIVGEPTLMEVVNAHKGLSTFTTIITGKAGHSSIPEAGVNAVFVAAKLLVELETIGQELRMHIDPTGQFTPPYSSVHVGKASGGIAVNTIPDSATIVWECRALPGFDIDTVADRLDRFAAEHLLPTMRQVAPGADIRTERLVNVPGLAAQPGSNLEHLVLSIVGQSSAQAVSYGTEAGHFQAAGVPTLVCGPGSIVQAHQADEWVSIEQLEACGDFLRRLIATLNTAD